tara:strand:- start:326 stop:1102 length:777 start_codon:yes stop_codon:yes gene_type:complete
MKLSIVIPAHNEEKRIESTLREYASFFEALRERKILDYELIVVLNACVDDTLSVVKNVKKGLKRMKILDFRQGGKGFAVKKGFEDALRGDGDLIGFVDADMATSPEAFYDLVKNIGNYDGIIASRYVKGSKVFPKQGWQRIIASRVFNFLVQILFFMFYRDTQCGAKLFKRSVVEKVLPNLEITHWAFDVNLLYICKKNGFMVREFPTVWKDKEYSKLNFWNAGPQMFFSLIRLRLLNSLFKCVVRIYDGFSERVKLK